MAKLSADKYQENDSVKFCFAEYPSIKIYEKPTGNSWKNGNHLLFGDYIQIFSDEINEGRIFARSRRTNGWVNIDEIRKDRILEVNFVDIGQGDGCHVVTPDDNHFIIDAGKTDNMNRYLSWRFNLLNRDKPLSFPLKLLISHSDSDHYYGFDYLFNNKNIWVDTIYHNGLVERPGAKPLGTTSGNYLTEIVEDTSEMMNIIGNSNNRSGKHSLYCKTLYKFKTYSKKAKFKSLSINDKYVPGFSNRKKINDVSFSLKILAPIIETISGKNALRSINDLGKDKNGHSVVLKLVYNKAKILLGGDINTEFGKIILDYYTALNKLDELQVDAAKACHHGSNHFHYGFLKAINSGATVISSGDEESYSHPRPDAIGALGKCGYGDRPLIFSTELARSNKEFTPKKLESIGKLYNAIKKLEIEIEEEENEIEKERLQKRLKQKNEDINSFLTKYGMINLRTDGERMIIAQKYEVPASHGKWDIHQLEYSDDTERFELI